MVLKRLRQPYPRIVKKSSLSIVVSDLLKRQHFKIFYKKSVAFS